tara:strand:+ start:1777 stop:1887 length:111 start_codon:yes stop_codon:yes gene_type:complete
MQKRARNLATEELLIRIMAGEVEKFTVKLRPDSLVK